VLVVCTQFFNPAYYQHRQHDAMSRQQRREQTREMWAKYGPMLKKIDAVQLWSPSGSAAHAVQLIAEGQGAQAFTWLGVLGGWVLVAGGTLGIRLRAEYRGEHLGSAPARNDLVKRERAWTLGGSSARSAIVEKELHSLRRTLPLLWGLSIPPLLVLMIAGLFHRGASGHSFPYALPLCVAYALLGLTQLFYNNLGNEGSGIQLLFLSPTPIRTVVLAKNLLHGVLFIFVAGVAVALGSFRLGASSPMLMAALAAWLLFALPCNLAAGNILSLTMPYRINPGRIGRPPGSQANSLTAMVIQAAIFGMGAIAEAFCWSVQKQWLAVPIFLALGLLAYVVWRRVLSNLDAMALQRRDDLISLLMKTS
jgi:ABC-2 type transport system permease protein